MKKLRLQVDELRVEGFRTGPAPAPRGTVVGHLPDTDPRVCPASQNWYCSVGYSCSMAPEYCA